MENVENKRLSRNSIGEHNLFHEETNIAGMLA